MTRLPWIHYLLEFIQRVGTLFFSLISQQGMWSHTSNGNPEWKPCFRNQQTFSVSLQSINWDDSFYSEDSKQYQGNFPFLFMNSRQKVELSCLRVWRLSGICIISQNNKLNSSFMWNISGWYINRFIVQRQKEESFGKCQTVRIWLSWGYLLCRHWNLSWL